MVMAMTDTPMENTLDAYGTGEIAWISWAMYCQLYKSRRCDGGKNERYRFAARCKEYVAKGIKNMDELLFNGEYTSIAPDAEKAGKRSAHTTHAI